MSGRRGLPLRTPAAAAGGAPSYWVDSERRFVFIRLALGVVQDYCGSDERFEEHYWLPLTDSDCDDSSPTGL